MTATYPPTPDLEHDARMKEPFGYELDDRMRTERDHKGYKVKDSMDWQDKLILWACVVVAILTVMLGGL